MHDMAVEAVKFIDLNWMNVSFLFIVGFIGGLVSGFIGSGGAFVLTPAMMSLGVPAAVAVASNMCHKFPKAMVGAYKRYKYGQVDIKLGLVMAASATVGVQIGIKIQEFVLVQMGRGRFESLRQPLICSGAGDRGWLRFLRRVENFKRGARGTSFLSCTETPED